MGSAYEEKEKGEGYGNRISLGGPMIWASVV